MNTLSIKSMSNQISKKKKKGFTLVELIIVIAIIAILAAMAIPKFGQVRTDAKVSNDIAAAKNIQSTTAMLVGNGTITDAKSTINLKTDDASGKLIIDRIDGATVPKAKDGNFVVTISDTGDITVTSSAADGVILAPANEKTASDYASKIKGKAE
ncbi:prepilin-type N-terminal cleavage/methylation domain-containing protein [Clostridium botulinum]|uniref:prepilin-type N-terminal cleavage/methylation domain-containing protein n=1 Tax=Clostridium botulinum TaxID=1491 RepID=UPI0003611701|nr:prepilin-type N-terminal cleavage/methylation domain-containing protein [Clostridium botulinum]MBN1036741.1 prepilin-type N-terminal cleavage/methylation domain-containing protein [Clostridium botulinum]MBN1043438.1 prepilin-type N-terminal cleavage/methylation domain-containing protein [Clostridium botulinum]NFL85568.1 prepilin-type N-terminal cleavage/methylation domain-containing protein [Clostridium botulinum]NFO21992.1 prepilin-type N-terminal cleavage/methylation domain-containing prot